MNLLLGVFCFTLFAVWRVDYLPKRYHQLASKLKENRLGFEPEITAYIAQEKCRVYECAIEYTPRTYEEGKKLPIKMVSTPYIASYTTVHRMHRCLCNLFYILLSEVFVRLPI